MTLTVGELRSMLAGVPDETELYFGGLEFYRLKQRGKDLLQVEFNQSVHKDSKTGKVVIEDHSE